MYPWHVHGLAEDMEAARRAFSTRSHGPDLTRVGDASPTHLTTIRNQGTLIARTRARSHRDAPSTSPDNTDDGP